MTFVNIYHLYSSSYSFSFKSIVVTYNAQMLKEEDRDDEDDEEWEAEAK